MTHIVGKRMIEDYLWLLRIIMVVDLMRTLMRFMVQEILQHR